jgi:hypothetical protein
VCERERVCVCVSESALYTAFVHVGTAFCIFCVFHLEVQVGIAWGELDVVPPVHLSPALLELDGWAHARVGFGRQVQRPSKVGLGADGTQEHSGGDDGRKDAHDVEAARREGV